MSPMLIYHYTNLEGFMGIVKDKALWATDIRYLNDSSEYQYLTEGVTDAAFIDSLGVDRHQFFNFCDELEESSKNRLSAGVFVSCFCEEQDLLSQWRGYGAGATGSVALGFDKDEIWRQLRESYTASTLDPNDPGFVLRVHRDKPFGALYRCVYDPDTRNKTFHSIFEWLNSLKTDSRTQTAASFVSLYAALVKHPSFSEEREWRLVIQPHGGNPEVKFRVGQSMLLPYVEVDLSLVFKRALREIVIGPAPSQEATRKSIRWFLKSCRLWEARILISEIPFRET